jgi:hypothetical protein
MIWCLGISCPRRGNVLYSVTRAVFLEDLSLGIRPRLRQPAQEKAMADDELPLPLHADRAP